jgi:hypothetical protein
MTMRGQSLTTYPYMFVDYDPALKRNVPFAVFDIAPHLVNGQMTRSFELTYKSVHSKSTFKRIIYQ